MTQYKDIVDQQKQKLEAEKNDWSIYVDNVNGYNTIRVGNKSVTRFKDKRRKEIVEYHD